MSAELLYELKSDFTNNSVTVTSTAELNAALETLSQGSGGTILVDGSQGPYHISAQHLGLENSDVLITALDADTPPHVEQIDIRASSNLTINGVKIDSGAISETRGSWEYDVNILASKGISIVDVEMTSDASEMITESNGAHKGENAIIIRDSEDIAVSHSTISDYYNGITYFETQGLDISHNDISGIQGDGLRGGGIQDVTISNNHIHDFYGTTQTLNHSDMIQIWGRNTTLNNENIEISDNVLDASNGAATQSIFSRNESFEDNGRFFQNYSIHGNIIHNAAAQGIGIADIQNVEIYDNTILWNQSATSFVTDGADPRSTEPRITLTNASGVESYGNIVSAASGIYDTEASDEGNIVLDYVNSESETYATDHFVNLTGHGGVSLQDLSIRPDSAIYGEYGAEASSDLQAPQVRNAIEEDGSDRIVSVLTQDDLPGRSTGVELSAKYTLVDGKPIDPETAKVTWFFDDGKSIEGVEVIHVFEDAGLHEVTMEVETQDGETASITRIFEAHGEEVFDIDFNAGAIDTTYHDSLIKIVDNNNNAFVEGRTGEAFNLDGRDRLEIDRTNEQYTDLKHFDIDLGFKMQAGTNSGNLLQLHQVFTLEVSDKGALTFDLKTSDGEFQVSSEDNALTAGKWADINVQYNGFAGTLDLVVDGDTVGSAAATGSTSATTGYSLTLGSTWHTSVKGAVDTFTMTTPDTEIKTPLSEESIVANESVDTGQNIVDAMMDDIATTSDPLPEPQTQPQTETETLNAPDDNAAEVVAPVSEIDVDKTPTTDISADNAVASDDDDSFLEELFDFIKELFGMSSDESTSEALNLAPYAQHADQQAFAKPMDLFEIVATTEILPETADTDGMEGEEDEDIAYSMYA